MSFLNHLEFQQIDRFTEIPVEHSRSDDIDLTEPVDDMVLEKFWDKVVHDIHEDPEWFSFNNE